MVQKLKKPKMIVVDTLADYNNLVQGDKVVVKVGHTGATQVICNARKSRI